MATVGNFDINKTPISNTLNNFTEFSADVTSGIKEQGADIGEALGLFITVIVYIILIVTVLGILFLVFRFVKNLMNQSRGLGKGSGS